ncbi:MAG TPA: class I SAM-dependent methyltransferase [Candidatus Nanoarchaeia archaeon]|nr:class I SAM-dependent methyltransferase [Candidatus Nanoarchaeia archaeon]
MADHCSRTTTNGYWISDVTRYGRVRETFGASLPYLNHQSILDFGCSRGLTSIELADICPDSTVVGIDIDTHRYSLDHPRLRFVHADGYRAPFRDKSFDTVICMNSLYHCMPDVSDETLRQRFHDISRLVKDDGLLLFGGQTTSVGRHEFVIFRKEPPIVPVDHKMKPDYLGRLVAACR